MPRRVTTAVLPGAARFRAIQSRPSLAYSRVSPRIFTNAPRSGAWASIRAAFSSLPLRSPLEVRREPSARHRTSFLLPNLEDTSRSLTLEPSFAWKRYLLWCRISRIYFSFLSSFFFFARNTERGEFFTKHRRAWTSTVPLSTRKERVNSQRDGGGAWTESHRGRKHRSIEQNHHLEDYIYSSCFSLFTFHHSLPRFEHRPKFRPVPT